MIVLDAHCDSPSQMYRLRDFSIDNPAPAQVDFPKMVRGGMTASFFALYIFPHLPAGEAMSYAKALLDSLDRQMKANPSMAAYAYSADDVRRNHDNGLLSILIGLENGSPVGKDIRNIEYLYKRGVRYITLTHSTDNQICDSCSGAGKWGGLSPFGHEVVAEMNRLGLLIDVAHCSDNTVSQVLDISSEPIAFTHGCCRAVSNHRRNLPDELMKKLADKGGVMGVSIYPYFISEEFCKVSEASGLEDLFYLEDDFKYDPSNDLKRKAWDDFQMQLSQLPRPGVNEVVDHIDHAVKVMGIEHVGLGTDYDGIEVAPVGLEDVSGFSRIFDEMSRRGYTDGQIEKIAGENMLRII